MLPHNQEIFLDHLGHEKGINKENYQCPAGVRTLRVMGRMLTDADEGTWNISMNSRDVSKFS